MYTDFILKEKWKAQKKIAKSVNYDIKKYMQNSHEDVIKLAKELKIKPKYCN